MISTAPISKTNGYSFIELVVVMAVAAMIAAIGIPRFIGFINDALLAATKASLGDAYKQCKANPDRDINLPKIPGVNFLKSDCSGEVTASINNECTLKMKMSNGLRTGWTNSYEECASTPSATVNEKISDWVAYEQSLRETVKAVPTDATSSCENVWGGTSYTGNASYAIDGDPGTKWTCNDSGKIDLNLDSEIVIKSVNVGFTGSTTNGNYIKIYIDDKLVAEGSQNAYDKTWLIQPTKGKKITYETLLSVPYVVDGNGITQSTTWSEIGELSVNGPAAYCTNKNSCSNNINDKDIQ